MSRSSEIRVAAVEGGEVRRLTGEPDMHDGGPEWSPDGQTIAYASERSGFYELHLVGRDGEDDRQLTSAGADHPAHDWHPDGTRLVAVRGHRNRFNLVSVNVADGSAEELAQGGTWYSPRWTAAGRHPRRVRGPRDAARDPPGRARHGRPRLHPRAGPEGDPQRSRTRSSRTSPTSRSTGSRSPAS